MKRKNPLDGVTLNDRPLPDFDDTFNRDALEAVGFPERVISGIETMYRQGCSHKRDAIDSLCERARKNKLPKIYVTKVINSYYSMCSSERGFYKTIREKRIYGSRR